MRFDGIHVLSGNGNEGDEAIARTGREKTTQAGLSRSLAQGEDKRAALAQFALHFDTASLLPTRFFTMASPRPVIR